VTSAKADFDAGKESHRFWSFLTYFELPILHFVASLVDAVDSRMPVPGHILQIARKSLGLKPATAFMTVGAARRYAAAKAKLTATAATAAAAAAAEAKVKYQSIFETAIRAFQYTFGDFHSGG